MIEHPLHSSRYLRSRQLANPAGAACLPPRQLKDAGAQSVWHRCRPPRSPDPIDRPDGRTGRPPRPTNVAPARTRGPQYSHSPTPGCRAATTLLLRLREPGAAFCRLVTPTSYGSDSTASLTSQAHRAYLTSSRLSNRVFPYIFAVSFGRTTSRVRLPQRNMRVS